jgi:hypothetical protein
MRGMTQGQLSAVVDFIYHGEVNIVQEDLNDFMAIAEELQLMGVNETESKNHDLEKMTSTVKRRSKSSPKQKKEVILQNNRPRPDKIPKTENILLETATYSINTNYDELDATVSYMMERRGEIMERKWACKVCGIENTNKFHTRNHIEAKHIDGVSHACNQCGKTYKSRHSLAMHKSRICF